MIIESQKDRLKNSQGLFTGSRLVLLHYSLDSKDGLKALLVDFLCVCGNGQG